MVAPIAPIPAIATTPTPIGGTTTPEGFGQLLGNAIDALQQTQGQAVSQANQVATGQANLGTAMVASTESLLATQLVVALRNGFVGALDQVMSTQF